MADFISSFLFGADDKSPLPHITTLSQLEEVREDCLKTVTRRAGIAAATSAIPVPLLDFGADTALLQRLNAEVTRRFGLTPEQFQAAANENRNVDSEDKKLLAMILSNVSGHMLGKGLLKNAVVKGVTGVGEKLFSRRLTRMVPLIGPAVSAGLSFGTLKLIGDRHVEECYAIAKKSLEGGQTLTPTPLPAALADLTKAPPKVAGDAGGATAPTAAKSDAPTAASSPTPATPATGAPDEADTHMADAVTDAGTGTAPN